MDRRGFFASIAAVAAGVVATMCCGPELAVAEPIGVVTAVDPIRKTIDVTFASSDPDDWPVGLTDTLSASSVHRIGAHEHFEWRDSDGEEWPPRTHIDFSQWRGVYSAEDR